MIWVSGLIVALGPFCHAAAPTPSPPPAKLKQLRPRPNTQQPACVFGKRLVFRGLLR
jgi:hypothetical protein